MVRHWQHWEQRTAALVLLLSALAALQAAAVDTTSLSSRVDPFWMPVRGNNCTASCQAVGMQPVRCTAGKDCDLCAGEAGGQLWMGTKRSLPDVCQWVNGTAAGKPLIKTWKFGYSCGCLPANAKAAPPRADAAWTKDTAAACPSGLSPVDRLCQVKFGTPWYMGWVSDQGNCTFYYPANGKAPTPRATSVAVYGRLCIPNKYAYVHVP